MWPQQQFRYTQNVDSDKVSTDLPMHVIAPLKSPVDLSLL